MQAMFQQKEQFFSAFRKQFDKKSLLLNKIDLRIDFSEKNHFFRFLTKNFVLKIDI